MITTELVGASDGFEEGRLNNVIVIVMGTQETLNKLRDSIKMLAIHARDGI